MAVDKVKRRVHMAIKFISVKCPDCGANLDVEEGRKQLFCSYCGAKVIINNDNEYIYRHIDEAKIRQAEIDETIRLKELEIEEKEKEKSRNGRYLAWKISGALAVIGFLLSSIAPGNSFSSGAIIIAICIAILAFNSGNNKTKQKSKKVVLSNEVQISKKMRYCKEENYNSVVALYMAAGFINIHPVPLCDLTLFTLKKNEQVEDIIIDGDNDFDEGDIFSKSSNIIITYHSVK